MNPEYNSEPNQVLQESGLRVASFVRQEAGSNVDWSVVESFGAEWNTFGEFSPNEIASIAEKYFDLLPADFLNKSSKVLEVGCGSGRWMSYLAPKVRSIDGIEPSGAVFTAARLLEHSPNARVTQATLDQVPFEKNTFDLVYCLGVLHHMPDTGLGIRNCVELVRPGGAFLVYLYYRFDNRGLPFKTLFWLSTLVRRFVSALPNSVKFLITDPIAALVYWPLAKFSLILEKMFGDASFIGRIPLSFYRHHSFWIMRNDARDRFGTSLEKRFTRNEIVAMLEEAGCTEIRVSEGEPFWHAIGFKK